MRKALLLLFTTISLASFGQMEEIPCTKWPGYEDCFKAYRYAFDYKSSDGVCYCRKTPFTAGTINGTVELLLLGSPIWITNLEEPANCPCDNEPIPQEENDGDTRDRYEKVLQETFQTHNLQAKIYRQENFGLFINETVWRVWVYSAGGGSHHCDFDHNPSYHEIITCMYAPETIGNN